MVTGFISQLARQFGPSRSTLIFYDKIRLLTAAGRSRANYRIYSEQDRKKLEQIAIDRDAGLSLEIIRDLLSSPAQPLQSALEARFAQIHREIGLLRRQQLSTLIEKEAGVASNRALTKERWVEILAASGMEYPDVLRWHIELERMAPAAHPDFLEALGIDGKEFKRIRLRSQEHAGG